MNNMRITSVLLAVFILAGCGVSKMRYEYTLNEANQKKIYNVCNYSKTFGQLDTWVQTDSPYHLYLKSGFYSTNHFSLSLTAHENKSGDAFYVKMRASGGKKFVRNVSKKQRKHFLLELKNALGSNP